MHGTINIQLANGRNHSIGGTIIGPRHIISVTGRETLEVTALKNGKIEGAISYFQPSPVPSVFPVKEVYVVESTGDEPAGAAAVFLLAKTLPKTVLYTTLTGTDLAAPNTLPANVKLTGWNGSHKTEAGGVMDKKESSDLKLVYTVTDGPALMGSAIWTSAYEKISVFGFHYQNGTGVPMTADKLEKIDKWMRRTDIDKSTGKEITELDAAGKMSKAEIRGITIDKGDLDKWPWNTHGLLRLKDKHETSYASATIIGPRHIVTAMHNLAASIGTTISGRYGEELEKYIKRSGEPAESYWPCFTGESLGKAGNPEDHEPYKPLDTIFKENRLTDVWQGGSIGDIALLTLKGNLEDGDIKDFLSDDFILEPVTGENLPEGTPVFIAGYPNKKNGRMWFAKGRIVSTRPDDFYFSADTVSTGSSGSAVWTYEGVFNGNKRRRLVGITSGGASDEPGCERGTLITGDIYRKLMEWLDFKKKVTDFTRELKSAAIPDRVKAAGKLGDLESLAITAIPALIASLGHTSNELNEEAARALGKICANADTCEKPLVGNTLIGMLESVDLDEKVKFAAAAALVSVDPFEAGRYFESIDRLAVFVKVFEDTAKDDALRASAVQAVGVVGGQFQNIESNMNIIFYVCQKLIRALDEKTDTVKKAALAGLENMKVKAAPAVDKLVNLLGREPGNLLNIDIMYALGAIIPPALAQLKISVILAKDALLKVTALKGSPDERIKDTARYIYPIIKIAVIHAEK